MSLNQNQNLNQNDPEIEKIVEAIKETNKILNIENYDTKWITIGKPNSNHIPVDSIYYQIFAPRIRMKTKMKINWFSGNFSLAMEVSKFQIEMLNKIENKIREETEKRDSELKKLTNKKIIVENLKLVKNSVSGPKMYGKIYVSYYGPSIKFFKKKNNNQKEEIKNPLDISSEFTGQVILELTRVFLGEKESIICEVKCVLVDEMEIYSFFDDFETM